MGRDRAKRVVAIALAVGLWAAASASAVAPEGRAQLVPLAMNVPDAPIPVLGADRRNHLVYEIEIANRSPLEVSLHRLQPLAGGRAFGAAMAAEQIASRLRLDSGGSGATIPPSTGATLFMDVTYPRRGAAPRSLSHHFEISSRDPSGAGPDTAYEFSGVRTRVSRAAPVEVEPPLRGERWLAANGCCGLNAHRGATLSIDGTVHTPERFAIDFVQLNAANRLFDGANELANYDYFGAPVSAAAAGRVVRIQDGRPEQTPGQLPEGQTIQTAGGNYVVVRIARSRFAFYAHLQPGSIPLEVGDRVRTGDRVGLLGNTGNTDGPHLHFHVMDSPSPLRSNGLPFTYRSFRGQGRASGVESLPQGGTATVDPAALRGRRRGQLPLENQLLAFPPRD